MKQFNAVSFTSYNRDRTGSALRCVKQMGDQILRHNLPKPPGMVPEDQKILPCL